MAIPSPVCPAATAVLQASLLPPASITSGAWASAKGGAGPPRWVPPCLGWADLTPGVLLEVM